LSRASKSAQEAHQFGSFQSGGIVDVSALLRSLGMERYEQAFRENAIDGDVLETGARAC